MTKKMGTNDVYCVVWAISTCFFKFFMFLFYINLYPRLLKVL